MLYGKVSRFPNHLKNLFFEELKRFLKVKFMLLAFIVAQTQGLQGLLGPVFPEKCKRLSKIPVKIHEICTVISLDHMSNKSGLVFLAGILLSFLLVQENKSAVGQSQILMQRL